MRIETRIGKKRVEKIERTAKRVYHCYYCLLYKYLKLRGFLLRKNHHFHKKISREGCFVAGRTSQIYFHAGNHHPESQ